MKKIILVGLLAFLLAAPRVLAHDRGQEIGLEISNQDENEHECLNASFHAGNEVEEEHESEQAKLHEHEDENEDCGTPSPSVSPTATPLATSTPTTTPGATSTPAETATPTPTATTLGFSFQGGSSVSLQALIQELINLLNKLLKGE